MTGLALRQETAVARVAEPARAARGALRPRLVRSASHRGALAAPGRRARTPATGSLAGAGRGRRAAGLLLLAGPEPSSAARWASRTRTRSCACCGSPRAPALRWSGWSNRAARGCRRVTRALAGYGRIFRASVELSARAPQISIVTRGLGGRRRLLAGAHRLRRHDRRRADVPHRAPGRPRGARRAGLDGGPGRAAGPLAKRRLPACRRRPAAGDGGDARAARPAAAARSASGAAARRPRRRRPAPRRTRRSRARPARSTTCATSRGRSSTGHASWSSRRPGRRTWSPGSRASRAGRSGSSPTSRGVSAG